MFAGAGSAAAPPSLDARWVSDVRHAAGGHARIMTRRLRTCRSKADSWSRSISIAARSAGGSTSPPRSLRPPAKASCSPSASRRSRRATPRPAPRAGGRRCPAAPRRRCIGTPAGCSRRRPPAISRRCARRTARWCGGGSSARRSSAPPGPALDRLFLPLADNRLVALLLANGETVWERTLSAPRHGAARARRSAGVRHRGESSDERRA